MTITFPNGFEIALHAGPARPLKNVIKHFRGRPVVEKEFDTFWQKYRMFEVVTPASLTAKLDEALVHGGPIDEILRNPKTDVLCAHTDGSQPMFFAVEQGVAEGTLRRLLLHPTARWDTTDSHNRTLATVAAAHGNLVALKLFAQLSAARTQPYPGLDPMQTDSNRLTALETAADERQLEVVDYLQRQYKDNWDGLPLRVIARAASKGHASVVGRMLDNAPSKEALSRYKDEVLKRGSPEVIRQLVDRLEGRLPSVVAALSDHPEYVSVVVALMREIPAQRWPAKEFAKALDQMMVAGNAAHIDQMLSLPHADVSIPGVHGSPPMFRAVELTSVTPDMLRKVLSHSSAIGHLDDVVDNNTLVTAAAKAGNLPALITLMEMNQATPRSGLNPHASNATAGQKNALQAAAAAGKQNIVDHLLPTDLGWDDGVHGQVIRIAAKRGHADMVVKMLDRAPGGEQAKLLLKVVRDGTDEVLRKLVAHYNKRLNPLTQTLRHLLENMNHRTEYGAAALKLMDALPPNRWPSMVLYLDRACRHAQEGDKVWISVFERFGSVHERLADGAWRTLLSGLNERSRTDLAAAMVLHAARMPAKDRTPERDEKLKGHLGEAMATVSEKVASVRPIKIITEISRQVSEPYRLNPFMNLLTAKQALPHQPARTAVGEAAAKGDFDLMINALHEASLDERPGHLRAVLQAGNPEAIHKLVGHVVKLTDGRTRMLADLMSAAASTAKLDAKAFASFGTLYYGLKDDWYLLQDAVNANERGTLLAAMVAHAQAEPNLGEVRVKKLDRVFSEMLVSMTREDTKIAAAGALGTIGEMPAVAEYRELAQQLISTLRLKAGTPAGSGSSGAYKVLGVTPRASDAEIIAARKSLAFKFHPDRNLDSPEAKKKFQELEQAFDKLKKVRPGLN